MEAAGFASRVPAATGPVTSQRLRLCDGAPGAATSRSLPPVVCT